MLEDEEGGNGVSNRTKKRKSKKARLKLKQAAGDGVGGVEMKRKDGAELGLKRKLRDDEGNGGAADGGVSEAGSKKRSRKRRKRGIRGGEIAEEGRDADEVEVVDTPSPKRREAAKPMSFLDKMRARLTGGQFRMLNETLYTCRGEDAYKLFQKDDGAFQLENGVLIYTEQKCLDLGVMYHSGYQEQMSHWPKLPVQVVMDWLKARSSNLVVADFGCGDARLAKGVNNKVYSLDLVACDNNVIACNMAKTPLEAGSIDVAVFCLSLMGVDYPSFLKEAHRVLKLRGFLLIAEVKSRFDPANGGASPNQFVEALKRLGFTLVSQDDRNKMFIMFTFKKQGENAGKKPINWPDLKPCVYKKR